MEEKYPNFPHCSVSAAKEWEKEIFEKTHHALDEIIHPIAYTNREHDPYFAID